MKKLFPYLILLISAAGFSQGSTCATATPFCAGAGNYIFENITSDPTGLGQVGCNFSTPNAAWFYLQIDEGGELIFNIQQGEAFDANGNVVPGTELDVDFIAWGPFASPAAMCGQIDLDECDGCPSNPSDPNFYPSGTVIDCSYSGSYNETLTIHNAIPGQIYAVLLTNFSQQPGSINLNQTNENASNAGSTDCSIVCPLTVSTPGIICASNPNTTVTALAPLTQNTVFTWFDPNGNQVQTGSNAQYTANAPGTYTVTANGQIASGQDCDEQTATFTVVEYVPPGLTPTTGITACNTPGPALFNLNSAIAQLGIVPSDFNINFYNTYQDAIDVAPNNIVNTTSYAGSNNEVIWISLESIATGCFAAAPVTLTFDCQNDMFLCDTNNDGTEPFDLTLQTAGILGSLNAADYTVQYHVLQADATVPTNPISPANAYPGANGQTIYASIQENSNPGNVSTTSFTLNLYPDPDAVIAASAVAVCVGGTEPVITFTGQGGTSPYVFTYTINSGPIQTVTSAAGVDSATINIPTTVAGTFDIDLTNVADVHCDTNQTESITVTVNPGPEAAILAPVLSACVGAASPQITFVGSNGTAPYTFTYTVGASGPMTIVSNGAGQATISVATATPGPVIVNVTDVEDANCTTPQTDTVTITINPLPEAALSATTLAVCQGGTAPVVTFTGSGSTGPYTFNYTVNGTAYTGVSGAGDTFTLNADTSTVGNQVINITNVSTATCSQAQTDTLTITINPGPDATIAAPVTAVCANGTSPQITITGTGGTAPYTFDYTLNTAVLQIVSDATGVAVVSIDTTTPGSFDFVLTNVSDANCSTPQNDAVTVVVNEAPDATISASTTEVCMGAASPIITISGTGGTAPYVFTYTFDGGAPVTLNSDAAGVATFAVPTAAAGNYIFILNDVADANCNSAQNDTVTIVVNPLPTATIISNITAVCQNGASPVITFTGSGGTSPYTFTYTYDGGGTLTATTAAGSDTVTVNAPTGTVGIFSYELTGVSDADCSQSQTGTVTITVNPLPTATLTLDTATVCQGGTTPFVTFTGAGGIAPYTFTYTLNGSAQSATTTVGDSVSVPVATTAAGTFDYVLTGVTESGATGCSQSQTGSVSVTVNPLPTATVTASATAVCLNAASPTVTFTGAGGTGPYTFTYTLEGGAPITVTGDPATVVVPTTAAGDFDYVLVSVSDSATPSCSQAVAGQAVTVSVIAPPVAIAPADLHLCDDNNDGYGCFDLTASAAQATGGDPALAAAFYLTAPDAVVGSPLNDIDDITDYCTIDPLHQTLYIRVWNLAAPACASVTQLELYVDARPVAQNPIPDIEKCDNGDNIPGTEVFDLAGHIPFIVNPSAGITVTFYHSEPDAQVPTGAIPAGPYTSAGEVIWVRLENAAGCIDISSFNLVVNPLPAVNAPLAPRTECIGADGMADFPLASYIPDISQGIPGVTVSFHALQSDAENDLSPLPSPYHTASATIWVRLENADCHIVASLELIGATGPALTVPAPLAVCDDNNDGYAAFDLTQVQEEVWGSSPVPAGVVFHYYLTQPDAEQDNGINQIGNPSAYTNNDPGQQTVFISVTAPGSSCPSVVALVLNVRAIPVAAENLDPVGMCDEDEDGESYFELTDLILPILNGMDPNTHTVAFYETAADIPANPITSLSPYESASGTILAVVTDTLTGCTDTVTITLEVLTQPVVADIPPYHLCDQDFDQHESFDLSTYVTGFLNDAGLTATFYHSQSDAYQGINPIGSPHVNDGPTDAAEFLWVRIENAQGCHVERGMDIVVDPLPVPFLPAPGDDLLVACDDNNDGHGVFDLVALAAYLQQGVPASQMVINFYLTEQDAELGANPLPITATYVNSTAYVQPLYIGVNNPSLAGNCRSPWMVELQVLPATVAQPLPDMHMCSPDQNGFATFDLTLYETDILGFQPSPGGPYQIFYYASQGAADAGSPSIVDPTSFYGADGQQIFYRVMQAGDCDTDVDSFTLQVDLPANLPLTVGLFSECADPDTGSQSIPWDLAGIVQTELNLGSQYQVAFFDPSGNPIADPSAYVNTAVAETITITVTDSVTTCSASTAMTIQVLPLPHPQPWTAANDGVITLCEQNNSGTASFDLTQYEGFLANGDGAMAFTYHTTEADAEAGTNPITGDLTQYASSGGIVYVRGGIL